MKNGNDTLTYTYDALGNITNVFDGTYTTRYGYDNLNQLIREANPLRYRGYYFDTETYMYYLNSRYYHPEYHRFINADGIIGANEDVTQYNLFEYCANNPVMFSDPNGDAYVYNGVTYDYDGSMGDFYRLERGQPPRAYVDAIAADRAKTINTPQNFHHTGRKTVSQQQNTSQGTVTVTATFDEYEDHNGVPYSRLAGISYSLNDDTIDQAKLICGQTSARNYERFEMEIHNSSGSIDSFRWDPLPDGAVDLGVNLAYKRKGDKEYTYIQISQSKAVGAGGRYVKSKDLFK